MLRDITRTEFEDYNRISALSFITPYEKGRAEFTQSPRIGSFADDGTLCAQLCYAEREAFLCAHTVKAVAVGGVASLPEKRRGGMVRKLFEELEVRAVENGWVLGALYPFSVAYYRKFGYEPAGRCFEYEIDFTSLHRFDRNTDAELYEGENFELLVQLYNEFASGFNLMLRRTQESICKTSLKHCSYVYMHRLPGAKADAYAAFRFDREASLMIVDELGYLNADALKGIIGFLRNYDGLVNRVRLRNLPLSSPLPLLLDSCNSAYPANMIFRASARIYDMESFLTALDYPEHSGEFSLKVSDSMPCNNSVFRVEFGAGQARVSRCDGGEADIELTACAAVRLLLSGECFDARRAGFIEGLRVNNEKSSVFSLLPFGETAIFDNF